MVVKMVGAVTDNSMGTWDNGLRAIKTLLQGEIGIASEEGILPEVYALHQNYPNFFNQITTIQYDLPEQSHVTITTYDILGRQVRTLVQSIEEPGFKSVV